MKLFWSVVFLLLCQTLEECESKIRTDPADIMNGTDRISTTVDFRCHVHMLTEDFDFSNEFIRIKYGLKDAPGEKKYMCDNVNIYYPILKGVDPMMPLYIKLLHRGTHLAAETDLFFLNRMTPLQRSREFCINMQMIAAAFLEYWEMFHGDATLCGKMVELVQFCHVFRQTRDMFAGRLHDKLCLDEDGCFNVMDYYEEDLPFCVKQTAISEFKNSSVGSWHHTIINYCKLTAMVPGVDEAKYDMKILREKGRTREKLRDMCLYLRYRVLPEEGKEQEIPDTSDYEYETFDTETTTEIQSGITSVLFTTACWNMVYVTAAYV